MSLLIKALQKAEQHKAADGDHLAAPDELSYSPASANANAESPKPSVQQAAAGLVFSAKNLPSNNDALKRMYLLAGAGLLMLLLLGGGFYYYLNSLQQPEILVPKMMAAQSVAPVAMQPLAANIEAPTPEAEVAPSKANQAAPAAAEITTADKSSLATAAMVSATLATASKNPATTQRPRATSSKQLSFGEPVTSTNAAVKVTRNATINAVNPTLLSAYRAFTAGDNTLAQRHYRQVLQADVRNVDALLGMAAIATRQGRDMDAAGWYGKVLEVEPRNTIAQSALLNAFSPTDPVGSESHIKNLLAQQPESADLYAALGNLYAEQKQWASAQQAYFQAHHFEPNNANHVYNLAISLDQLGKSQLALRFYKETLALLASAQASGIDQTQLERRIAQLQ